MDTPSETPPPAEVSEGDSSTGGYINGDEQSVRTSALRLAGAVLPKTRQVGTWRGIFLDFRFHLAANRRRFIRDWSVVRFIRKIRAASETLPRHRCSV